MQPLRSRGRAGQGRVRKQQLVKQNSSRVRRGAGQPVTPSHSLCSTCLPLTSHVAGMSHDTSQVACPSHTCGSHKSW